MKSFDQKWVVAHRGGALLQPENTKKAFDHALNYPIQGLECDLQLTKDGVPILFHDRTLYKFGLINKRLKNFSLSTLKKHKEIKFKHSSISGNNLLSFEKFLKNFQEKNNLFIEIKSRPHDQKDGTSDKLLSAITYIANNNIRNYKNIYWMSFDHLLVDKAIHKLKGGRFIKLTEDAPSFIKNTNLENIFGVGFPIRQASHKLVHNFHSKGLATLTYTCNKPRQLKKALSSNIDILVTDRPDWLSDELGVS